MYASERRRRARPSILVGLLEDSLAVPAEPQRDDATRFGVPASNRLAGEDPDRAVIDETGVKLWQLLDGRTPTHVDDLALRAQIPAREALGKLAELELKGMAVRRPGKYFLRR